MTIHFSPAKLRAVRCAAMAAAAVLVAPGAGAQDTPSKAPMAKLMQAPPGRVIFEFGSKPKAAASAPAPVAKAGEASTTAATGPAGSTSGVQPRPASTSAPAEEAKFDFLGSLPPPSGRSLNAARRLDAPDQGIVIKDAAKSTK